MWDLIQQLMSYPLDVALIEAIAAMSASWALGSMFGFGIGTKTK